MRSLGLVMPPSCTTSLVIAWRSPRSERAADFQELTFVGRLDMSLLSVVVLPGGGIAGLWKPSHDLSRALSLLVLLGYYLHLTDLEVLPGAALEQTL